jgi:hypothetical protein
MTNHKSIPLLDDFTMLNEKLNHSVQISQENDRPLSSAQAAQQVNLDWMK